MNAARIDSLLARIRLSAISARSSSRSSTVVVHHFERHTGGIGHAADGQRPKPGDRS
ncbi:hypothetical protein [Rhodococcus wratislaviensis]|uniref:hypothetical protein n=1 Tax=Rhodococcus wratislaviensis TaxID=44752 RepID=UPI0004B65962|nr:hypothetical protein [Rhodococcus wratislaviensis]